jgi:hypothetical protein
MHVQFDYTCFGWFALWSMSDGKQLVWFICLSVCFTTAQAIVVNKASWHAPAMQRGHSLASRQELAEWITVKFWTFTAQPLPIGHLLTQLFSSVRAAHRSRERGTSPAPRTGSGESRGGPGTLRFSPNYLMLLHFMPSTLQFAYLWTPNNKKARLTDLVFHVAICYHADS